MTEPLVPNHYNVLDLPSTAKPEEIEQSYHAAVRHCHPDSFHWKDQESMDWAAAQFKALTHAHDVLTDPARRSSYDKVRGEVNHPLMYGFGRGYVYADNELPRMAGTHSDDYDKAWREFIAQPFGWTERGLSSYNKWGVVHSLLVIGIVVLALVFFGQSSGPEIYQFLATTHSAPTVESDIPMTAASIGVGLAFVITLVVVVRMAAKLPYSTKHSAVYRRCLVDQAIGMLVPLIYAGVFFGAVIGHYLF